VPSEGIGRPTMAVGYLGGGALFGGALAILVRLWRFMSVSRVVLFWSAFILPVRRLSCSS